MKKIIPLIILILNLNLSKGQSITDTVYFNNYTSPTNNDLVNNFSNTSWITLDTLHGITGGSLDTPDSLSWGNDLISYCKNYNNVIDTMMMTTISFKYNSALVMPAPHYERAVAIFYEGNIINHNIAYYLNRDRTVTIITYGLVTNSAPLSLITGHWYSLVANLKCQSSPTDWFFARAELYDLGINGISVPVVVTMLGATAHDSELVNSPEFNVRVCGARWGGGEYLDNFTFHGIPGTSNCVPVSVTENGFNSDAITIYPQPASDMLNISFNRKLSDAEISYSLLDISGREMLHDDHVNSKLISLPIGQLSGGLYLLHIRDGSQLICRKIIVE